MGTHNNFQGAESKLKVKPGDRAPRSDRDYQTKQELDRYRPISLNPEGMVPFETPRVETPLQILFAPNPEDDGSFKLLDLKTEKAWDSLYALTLTSSTTARVDLVYDSDLLPTLLSAPQRYLGPVCRYANDFDANPTSIQVLNAGTAILEGQRWHIQNKLEIEFI
jgi:hypothetical protein